VAAVLGRCLLMDGLEGVEEVAGGFSAGFKKKEK
jgi:hypothetical protein